MFYRWYQFVRLCYYPFLNWILPLFIKKLRSRIRFEKRNFTDIGSQSFYKIQDCANYAFEFSSEGEFEQVRPLVVKALEGGEKVELLFSSESVEKHVIKLYLDFPNQIRYRRLFLVTYNPLSMRKNIDKWMTAKKFYMCRYDFFPELIKKGSQKDIEFILLWASLKTYQKSKSSFFMRRYYEYVYKCFDKIIAATPLDHAQFSHDLNIDPEKLEVYDFRPVQILKRIELAQSTLNERIPFWNELKLILEKYPKNKRIIYGSFWPIEVELFKNFKDKSYIHVIVPHQLDKCDEIISSLESLREDLNIQKLDKHSQIIKEVDIYVLDLKGVLCELYSSFGNAYVGGGFGISVHSLMEAFLAQASVICGPKIMRSTEYDLISQSHPDHLKILNEMQDFYQCISYDEENLSSLDDFIHHYKGHYIACALWAGVNLESQL
jgi:3-deoxy-D-manno-octulosonic-acid transferase